MLRSVTDPVLPRPHWLFEICNAKRSLPWEAVPKEAELTVANEQESYAGIQRLCQEHNLLPRRLLLRPGQWAQLAPGVGQKSKERDSPEVLRSQR